MSYLLNFFYPKGEVAKYFIQTFLVIQEEQFSLNAFSHFTNEKPLCLCIFIVLEKDKEKTFGS